MKIKLLFIGLLISCITFAQSKGTVSGVLSVYYIFKLGEKMISKNMGYIAAILLTINLYHIEYSQEARSYSLFVLFVITIDFSNASGKFDTSSI